MKCVVVLPVACWVCPQSWDPALGVHPAPVHSFLRKVVGCFTKRTHPLKPEMGFFFLNLFLGGSLQREFF